ncbi:hypothetical protein CONPUDRAFT_166506 [Coniophora puteana RWD-64-598 SS2]|uniref:Methyltransferase n=1 Tax=Coniophora puteana (strain RWD-64-598) TaxID=741705 RepID=A0A5M3ML63_CONPW|nr:uncharacterized protein CONPUDRAFT_166506 [Coniophora puteana RWD-64-598 SS2]EIW79806.1 hypothetical protein CONPUDRAFT_166506 [Coniophora puteana RWD-64-598 SS2]
MVNEVLMAVEGVVGTRLVRQIFQFYSRPLNWTVEGVPGLLGDHQSWGRHCIHAHLIMAEARGLTRESTNINDSRRSRNGYKSKTFTMTIETTSRRDVPTTLQYYASTTDSEGPYIYTGVPPEGVPGTNITSEPYAVVVRDVRGSEDAFGGLDKKGFQYAHHVSQEKLFAEDSTIKGAYYQEIEELLKAQTGAKRVFIFDHTIRRTPKHEGGGKSTYNAPITSVHIDQTTEAAIQRVRDHMGDDAEHLLKGRFRIINVWRPIENTVAHTPLAVADFTSFDVSKDLLPVRFILPHGKIGSIYYVRHNAAHRWYYLADQTVDEVVIFKCFDSADGTEGDVAARVAPHAAFKDASSPADAPERQSIEVRALVFDTE